MRRSLRACAVALLFVAFVGPAAAVRPQPTKTDRRLTKDWPKREHMGVEAAATSDAQDVPDARIVAVPPVGAAAKFDNHTTEMRLLEERLKFEIPEEIKIPFLPTIGFMGLSLSLTNVTLKGMNKYKIYPTDIFGPEIAGEIKFQKLTLLADPYVAGGHLLNMPFVGEGALNITVLNFAINVGFHRVPGSTYCPKPNTTVFTIKLERLIVKFENLNPGQDSGEFINTMLSNYGHDLVALLSIACNDENLLHPKLDKIAVKIISSGCSYRSEHADPEADAGKVEEACSPQGSKSCGRENSEEQEEGSSSLARGVGGKGGRLSASVGKHVDELARLITASIAEPLAEILEESFKLQ